MTEHVRQRHVLLRNRVPRAWSVSFPDPISPDGVRGDRARNMVAEVARGAARVRNDFDRVSIYQRPIFNATWDDNARRWVDLVRQGEEGFSFCPTEENREVVYRCTPFWYRVEYTDEGGLVFASVTDRPLAGYKLAPMFKNGSTYEYRPCFEMSLDEDGNPHSRAGMQATTSTPAELMDALRSYSSCARTEKMADWFCDYILMLVEFGTRNLQGIMRGVNMSYVGLYPIYEEPSVETGFYVENRESLAVGTELRMICENMEEVNETRVKVVSVSDEETEFGYRVTLNKSGLEDLFDLYEITFARFPCKTGSALTQITNASSGFYETDGRLPCVWRGKENPWGNISSLVCDVLFDFKNYTQMDVYTLADPQMLDGELNDHYTKIETREFYFQPNREWGYVEKFSYVGEDYRMIPAATQLTSVSLNCATHTQINPPSKNGGIRFLRVGGDYNIQVGVNAACFDLFGGEYLSKFGARMILEEAIG